MQYQGSNLLLQDWMRGLIEDANRKQFPPLFVGCSIIRRSVILVDEGGNVEMVPLPGNYNHKGNCIGPPLLK